MENFFKNQIMVTNFSLACFVAEGEGSSVHENRPNFGLMINIGEDVLYKFNDGNKIKVSKGEILYFPKNSSYVIEVNGGNCYAINFELFNINDTRPFLFKPKNKTVFLESFKEAENAWRRKGDGYEMKCMSLLYKIFYNMRKDFEYSYIGKRGREILMPAVEYIHECYTTDKIRVSHLAEICGISETYFRTNFQKVFGVSPVKYVNSLRILRAKELIKSGMYSVSKVSKMSGFNDEAYFSREFKKVAGVNPSAYKDLNDLNI